MVVLRPQLSERGLSYSIPPEDLSHLTRTPWCAALLNDPTFVPVESFSRNPQSYHVGRYSFMSKVLKTYDTLRIWQPFYRTSSGENDCGEVRIIVELGEGMDGHLHTAHGGVAATLMDEAMGMVGGIHKRPGWSHYTAYLHVNYKKPIPTPCVLLIKTRLSPKSTGRKIYTEGSIENGDGTVYISAEALFLEVERKPKARI